MVAVLAAIATVAVMLLAERLHARRVYRVRYLAFGPSGRPAPWVAIAPVVRALCMGMAVLGALKLWGFDPAPSEHSREARASRQLLICLDVSPSMRIQDAGPEGRKVTRAAWAANIVDSLLQRIDTEDTRITVVTFYSRAIPVLVDTYDKDIVAHTVRDLPLSSAFQQGKTDLAVGVNAALEIAKPWARRSATLVVLSDGDADNSISITDPPASIADSLVLGVGDTQRASSISTHHSRQDASSLKLLAARLRGIYLDASKSVIPAHIYSSLTMSTPNVPSAWSDREVGLVLLLVSSAGLAFLTPLLALFGARNRTDFVPLATRPIDPAPSLKQPPANPAAVHGALG